MLPELPGGGGGGLLAGVDGEVLGVVGDADGAVEDAPTVTDSFMPPWQWPGVGQMKYHGPAVVRVMLLLPPL